MEQLNTENLEVQPQQDTTQVVPATPVAQQEPEPLIRINAETGEIEIADEFFGVQATEPTEPTPATVPEVKPYSLDEVSNTEIDKLDPARIPADLVPFYKSMLADYTRKTQALSTEKKTLEQKLAQMNQPQQVPQQQPEVKPQQEVQQKSYYEQLYDYAIKELEKPDRLGVPFNEMNPLHLTALTSEVATIQNKLTQQQSHQEQLSNVVSRYTSDPRWSEIQTYADSVLDNLGYSESKAIRDKLTSGDLNYIDKFLKTAKEVFYETEGGTKIAQPAVPTTNPVPVFAPRPTIQPPVLEGSGVGIQASPASSIDVNQLGKMTNDQLANFFVQKGLINQ